MASTYSSLKIQLMATGENSGTWGTVTNTNLGTAIEEAIVGSVDVSFSNADVTLTLTDTNATQSARNLRLNLTGTVATPQSLIVPAIEKVYIINNGLTQTITVKNSTGTGIAVPAGKTMYVYNNATNVVDAITHLTSLTLATALPVASGGTGSNTATFSGANITSINADNISSGTLANARTTASSSNGASTIVARDASGNFTGYNVSATNFIGTLNGSGANVTSINAENISSGTLANARTTASSSNGASTIVSRDASGNFAGNVVTIGAGTNSAPSLTFSGDSNTGIYSSGADSVNFAEGAAGYKVGFRNVPAVGTKTGSYTLAVGDVGKYVQVSTGGSITIPDATFAESDVISIFNNTSAGITITCTITTAYIAGTDSDKASVTLATRGVCSILFISSTVCVITGNVS